MESKKKKIVFNVIMVALIAVMAVSGVMVVGNLKGWFSGNREALLTCVKVNGVANIERSGVGYSLKKGVALQEGDVIETKNGSVVELELAPENSVILNEKTELEIVAARRDGVELKIRQGQIFADTARVKGDVKLEFAENTASLTDAVFAADVYTGSASLSVFEGGIDVTKEDGSQEYVEAGESLSVLQDKAGGSAVTVGKLQAPSLSEFLIQYAQNCVSSNELCFTVSELQQVLDNREAERQAALQESLNAAVRIPKNGTASENVGEKTAEETDSVLPEEENLTDGETEYTEDYQAEASGEGSVSEYVSGADDNEGGADYNSEDYSDIKTCTITIRCDTILDNMENLSAGKEAYVPANGCILSTSTVEFTEGETVFDVLSRVCEYAGIQLEYSWTPMYNSYYIEGINNLYEFDCGNESGWMFKVNGWYPNYGCSAYTLEDGDTIVWNYTCNGLGADLGASVNR